MESWLSLIAGIAYLGTILAFVLFVIMRRRPVGVSLAWLVLLFALPIAGIIFYLLFGTRRLGTTRLQRAKAMEPSYEEWSNHLQKVICTQLNCVPQKYSHIYNLTERTMRIPALPGNSLQLFQNSTDILDSLIDDIDRASNNIHLEFYIWEEGGEVDRLTAALIEASQRNVSCRILLDAVGSSQFLRCSQVTDMRAAGIKVQSSLPVGPVRMLFERIDLRNHRKLAVIDDQIAWTGSYNLVDPRLFKQDAGVGQWIDAMVRIQGPAAHVLGAIFLWDWEVETGHSPAPLLANAQYALPYQTLHNDASIHALPSGPGMDRELLHQVLLTAIYECQKELIISTPYFVPDEALMSALKSTAMRGVRVQLVVPEKNDSRLVHYASRSYYNDLINAGVEIHQFRDDLLHTKCVLIDRETTLFGTVNLDMRSVWLNFELTLIIYDQAFGQRMGLLMEEYLGRSERLNRQQWLSRPFTHKLRENTAQLLSPLL